MLGYDTMFINGAHDDELLKIAWKEGRVLLTRDSGIMKRRVVTSGKARAIFIETGEVKEQLQQVIDELELEGESDPFTICMECNTRLVTTEKEEIPYVYETRNTFMRCPECGRVYWRGTHWERMVEELGDVLESNEWHK